jgi:hypothetical protein
MIMAPFEVYRYYLALRLHFTTDSYDVIKQQGRVRATKNSFLKRKDLLSINRVAETYSDKDIVDFLVANFVSGDRWGGVFDVESKERYQGWKKRIDAKPSDIGISASHRAMNGAIMKALGDEYPGITVDTPERWQGLQRPIMIAVHPLSGVTQPSDFDLSTGRLCVMASRHQVGLIFVARDHVGKTIEDVIPSATQSPGELDVTGRGRRSHLEFWEMLRENNRVVSLV